jgi:hypothetical protein
LFVENGFYYKIDSKSYPAIQAPQIRQILVGLKEQLNEVLNMTEIYCIKWLDGLTPLIDTEPEKVLQELLEILKKLV